MCPLICVCAVTSACGPFERDKGHTVGTQQHGGPGKISAYSESLRAGRSGDRIPVGGEIFRTRPFRSGGPTILPYKGIGSFPGVKRPGRGVDHTPHLAPRLKKEQSYTSTPPLGLSGLFQGELYLYLYRVTFFFFLIIILARSYAVSINTLRTGAFKLFKCTFPGSKQFKSTFILCFFKNL